MSRGTNAFVEEKLLSNPVVKCVIKHGGAVFGGYLRGFFANQKSHDIDVVVHRKQHDAFHADMLALEYKSDLLVSPNGTYIYTKGDGIEVEVLIEEDADMEGQRLCCYAAPDYSVNLLAYDKDGLYDWTGEFEAKDILMQIYKRIAISLEPTLARKKKFATKGFTIVA